LDAPISGGQAGAEGGIFTVMVRDEAPIKKLNCNRLLQ